MEPENEIPACNIPLDQVAVVNERSIRRYLEGQTLWDKKYSGVNKSIEKSRRKNLKLATKEGSKTMAYLKHQLHLNGQGGTLRPPNATAGPSSAPASPRPSDVGRDMADEEGQVRVGDVLAKTVLGSRHWTWGWVLEGENPPPASIVSRRDTEEARRLSKFADRQLGPGDAEHQLSGNHLWSVIVEALAAQGRRDARKSEAAEHTQTTPGPAAHHHHRHRSHSDAEEPSEPTESPSSPASKPRHHRSLSRFFTFHRRSHSSGEISTGQVPAA